MKNFLKILEWAKKDHLVPCLAHPSKLIHLSLSLSFLKLCKLQNTDSNANNSHPSSLKMQIVQVEIIVLWTLTNL